MDIEVTTGTLPGNNTFNSPIRHQKIQFPDRNMMVQPLQRQAEPINY